MDKTMMTTTEKKIIPELFEMARNLSEEAQHEMIQFGRLLLLQAVLNDER